MHTALRNLRQSIRAQEARYGKRLLEERRQFNRQLAAYRAEMAAGGGARGLLHPCSGLSDVQCAAKVQKNGVRVPGSNRWKIGKHEYVVEEDRAVGWSIDRQASADSLDQVIQGELEKADPNMSTKSFMRLLQSKLPSIPRKDLRKLIDKHAGSLLKTQRAAPPSTKEADDSDKEVNGHQSRRHRTNNLLQSRRRRQEKEKRQYMKKVKRFLDRHKNSAKPLTTTRNQKKASIARQLEDDEEEAEAVPAAPAAPAAAVGDSPGNTSTMLRTYRETYPEVKVHDGITYTCLLAKPGMPYVLLLGENHDIECEDSSRIVSQPAVMHELLKDGDHFLLEDKALNHSNINTSYSTTRRINKLRQELKQCLSATWKEGKGLDPDAETRTCKYQTDNKKVHFHWLDYGMYWDDKLDIKNCDSTLSYVGDHDECLECPEHAAPEQCQDDEKCDWKDGKCIALEPTGFQVIPQGIDKHKLDSDATYRKEVTTMIQNSLVHSLLDQEKPPCKDLGKMWVVIRHFAIFLKKKPYGQNRPSKS